MKRYELLEFKHADNWHDQAALDRQSVCDRLEHFRDDRKRDYARMSLIERCLFVLVLRHMEFNMRREFVERSLEAGPEIAIDYFFGDWMEDDGTDWDWPRFRDPRTGHLNPAYEETRWISPLLNGMLLARLEKDRITVQRLSEWVAEDCVYDSGSRNLTKEDNYFYILLAHHLSGRVPARQAEFETAIGKSRNKRPKLLLECLNTLQAWDEQGFHKSLKAFLKRYFKTERGTGGLVSDISVDGSLLHHMAQDAGFALAPLPDKEQALIMTRDTLNLQ